MLTDARKLCSGAPTQTAKTQYLFTMGRNGVCTIARRETANPAAWGTSKLPPPTHKPRTNTPIKAQVKPDKRAHTQHEPRGT